MSDDGKGRADRFGSSVVQCTFNNCLYSRPLRGDSVLWVQVEQKGWADLSPFIHDIYSICHSHRTKHLFLCESSHVSLLTNIHRIFRIFLSSSTRVYYPVIFFVSYPPLSQCNWSWQQARAISSQRWYHTTHVCNSIASSDWLCNQLWHKIGMYVPTY